MYRKRKRNGKSDDRNRLTLPDTSISGHCYSSTLRERALHTTQISCLPSRSQQALAPPACLDCGGFGHNRRRRRLLLQWPFAASVLVCRVGSKVVREATSGSRWGTTQTHSHGRHRNDSATTRTSGVFSSHSSCFWFRHHYYSRGRAQWLLGCELFYFQILLCPMAPSMFPRSGQRWFHWSPISALHICIKTS